MTIAKQVAALWGTGLALVLGAAAVPADDPPKAAEPGTLIVVDAAGKEQKLKSWKFVGGTRPLSWLAAAEKEPEKGAKPAAAPEALEFRDENSTNFVEGILTLIPLDQLRAIDYDNDKKTVSARAATGPKDEADEVLTGTTRFEKINKLIIEAEVDKGDLGIAELKFLGGVPNGIRGVRFPPPKVAAAGPAGRPAVVTTADRQKKTTQKVTDLKPLYRTTGGEQLHTQMFFKKTLKIDVAKVQKLVARGGEADEGTWQVTLKDGGDETLTLLPAVALDGKAAKLEGLLGRVPAGYKLFPMHAISEVQFDMSEEPKPDKP
jgi:hypothetical protein